jgi:uncharacterized protein YbaR (Trm112 family)
MLAPELLEILVCPVCKKPGSLVLRTDSLLCSICHRAYPIRDDIPVMLVDEAKIEQG